MNTKPLFIDLGYSQCQKHGQDICGDAFKFQKIPEENRLVAVLSDGLGSGVKANILASMTATMAVKFVSENTELLRSAEIMMSALPVCQIRKISYATFTIVDTALDGKTRIIEMGNPRFILLRSGTPVEVPFTEIDSKQHRNRTMRVYDLEVGVNDRLIFFSDGISQAGLGTNAYPLGWRVDGCRKYLENTLCERRETSAHELADSVIREALRKEPGYSCKDDMTCAVMYFRKPRKMLLFTGPPFDRERDTECAVIVDAFDGDKILCGGTTAEIVSRELKQELTMDLTSATPDLPPVSHMEGIDLITEGIFTLTRTAQLLENKSGDERHSPAGRLVEVILRNDIIEFLVGTRINEAHQDPNLPIDLELRRNIVQRIAETLRRDYLKEVTIKYV
ncbi:SpoIIE family protein phosphatase [Lentisphaerota bacterium ZTH]|nr:SpoIIE family protein phosphatase [Lentisphaerota bacterium]WET07451.1 SpoIIE family protein phosphatase [Lentisphaerota bacterium ZTH]